jgi:uncharacterized protein
MTQDGSVYSCDHFVDLEHRLGNIQDTHLADLVSKKEQRDFGLNKRKSLSKDCQKCAYLFACQGGCPKNRFKNKNETKIKNYLCQDYHAFFKHVDTPMRIMTSLLSEGRSPVEIMKSYAGSASMLN